LTLLDPERISTPWVAGSNPAGIATHNFIGFAVTSALKGSQRHALPGRAASAKQAGIEAAAMLAKR